MRSAFKPLYISWDTSSPDNAIQFTGVVSSLPHLPFASGYGVDRLSLSAISLTGPACLLLPTLPLHQVLSLLLWTFSLSKTAMHSPSLVCPLSRYSTAVSVHYTMSSQHRRNSTSPDMAQICCETPISSGGQLSRSNDQHSPVFAPLPMNNRTSRCDNSNYGSIYPRVIAKCNPRWS